MTEISADQFPEAVRNLVLNRPDFVNASARDAADAVLSLISTSLSENKINPSVAQATIAGFKADPRTQKIFEEFSGLSDNYPDLKPLIDQVGATTYRG